MLIQRGIMKNSLDGCDGKSASGGLVYAVRYFPGHIYSGEGCVVAEGEPVGVSGLPVFEPGVLLCVAIDELNLESGVVDEKNLGCLHIEIRTEKNLPDHLVTAFEFRDHDLDLAFEGFCLYRGAEKGHLPAIDGDSVPDEHILTEIMDVDSPVKFPGTAAAALLRTGVEILQHRVVTQPAHDIESEPDGTCDKVVAGEQAVSYENVRDFEQLFPVLEYRPETLSRLIAAVILHVFKIERRAASCGERHRLNREKKPGVTDPRRHLGEPKDLKAPFRHAGTPRPIPAKTGSLLSGFADEAVVKGDGDPVPVIAKGHAAVEGAPVELLLEVLPEAALAGVPVPSHRQETESSVYRQYQNHCLHEETFKIFSYFCTPVERVSDNRTYLVKWLEFIHNSLISNYKVTKNSSLDQIFLALILLKIKEIDMFYSILFSSQNF